MTVLRVGAASDVGRARTVNEDSFAVVPDRHLYVVADGMGGHLGGEVASRLAVDTLRDAYQDRTADALTAAVVEANRRIHVEGDDRADLHGMGTTVVAAALVPEEADPDAEAGPEPDEVRHHLLIANVGDSRAYLFRDGDLIQVTDDHSLVADLVREGRITAEEAEVHPQRNIVTRVLGVYEHVDVDLWPVDPVRGDRVLLCSDGLFNEVGDDQIGAVLRRLDDPDDAAAELVRLANEAGGRDNITVVVLDVVDDGGVAREASAALAGSSSTARRADRDLAGFSTALDDRDGTDDGDDGFDSLRAAPPSGRRRRRGRGASSTKTARRVTWRAVLFTLLVLGVVGAAIATIQWYGTSAYYVGFEGDEVVIFQGRPGGLLWIDPTLEDATDIHREEVPERYLPALEAGHEQSSLADAQRYVSNIERDIIEEAQQRDEAEAATTTTTAPTTTVPPAAP